MRRLTIAFLYNLRRVPLDPKNPKTHLEADFDDPQTIETMSRYLKKCGFKVLPIEANQEVYSKLRHLKNKIDLAFNFAEGIVGGKDREAHIPALLEMLHIPYTGSPPLTQALVLNKAKTKEILRANNVPTLPDQVFKNVNEELKYQLKFPLIVKPVSEGSSAGLTNKSVVFDKKQLKKQVAFVLNNFGEPALVEPFLEGRDFSVALLGNPPKVLPIVELNHSQLPTRYRRFASLEVKHFIDAKQVTNYLSCPAKITKKLKKKLEEVSLKTWEALEILDWCRVDIRCDTNNNPYVLEVNSPASLDPPEGASGYCSFPLAAKMAGMDYQDLLKMIIKTALKRYGVNYKIS